MTTNRRNLWWISVVSTLLALATPAFGGIYTDGHADIGVGYEGGNLHPHFHAEGATIDGVTSSGEFEPSEITILVPLSVYRDNHGPLNASDAYNVPESLGLTQGNKFWNLPEYFETDVPFLGLGAGEIAGGVFEGNKVQLALTAMAAPAGGQFTLWNANVGRKMESFNGIDPAADSVDLPTGSHGHWSWAFSTPGDYYLTLKASGTLLGTNQLLENSGTFHFRVVPEPSTLALTGIGLAVALGFGAARRRRTRASQEPLA